MGSSFLLRTDGTFSAGIALGIDVNKAIPGWDLEGGAVPYQRMTPPATKKHHTYAMPGEERGIPTLGGMVRGGLSRQDQAQAEEEVVRWLGQKRRPSGGLPPTLLGQLLEQREDTPPLYGGSGAVREARGEGRRRRVNPPMSILEMQAQMRHREALGEGHTGRFEPLQTQVSVVSYVIT